MLKHSLHICSIIILFFLLSCSSEKPAEFRSQKPSETGSSGVSETSSEHEPSIRSPYSLVITPQDPARNSTLYLIPGGFNLSDAKVEWLVNGILAMSALPDQFKTTETNKDNTVQAKAVIKGAEVLSNVVKIKNSSPEISKIKILPEIFKPGDNLYVEVTGTDIDGDDVTFSYEWTKNEEPAGNGNRLELPVKRGDKVTIRITAFDGENHSLPVILKREIRNMPPTILENKELIFYGRTMTYQVKAEDPDGDTLTFSLKSSSEGMEIDSSTGLIRWEAPAETIGKQNFTISVNDGHGGEAFQALTFEMPPEQRVKR